MAIDTARDIYSAKNRKLALTDQLTGLGNRKRFFDKIEKLIAERAEDPVPFAICIVDLDGFKPINDLFGRQAGDEILTQVALRLRGAMVDGAFAARIGGGIETETS